MLAQLAVNARVFRAHQVLREVRLERLDERRQAHGVREIEARVEVERPIALGANAFTDFLALVESLPHRLVGIERLAFPRVGRRPAEGAEAGFDTGARGLFEAAAAWEPGRITFHVVAREPAEHLKHRHA